MSRNWQRIICNAEKLIGAPPPYIDFAPFSTPESDTLVSRTRKVLSKSEHPLRSVIKESIKQSPYTNPFSLSIGRKDVSPGTSGGFVSAGLLLLLHGQILMDRPDCTRKKSRLLGQHRKLAEIYETVFLAVSMHRCIKDEKSAEVGNKLCILIGDSLLSKVSLALAKFEQPRVVGEVSDAIGALYEAEFHPFLQHPDYTNVDEAVAQWKQFLYLFRGKFLVSLFKSMDLLSVGEAVSDYEALNCWNLLEQTLLEATALKTQVQPFYYFGLERKTLSQSCALVDLQTLSTIAKSALHQLQDLYRGMDHMSPQLKHTFDEILQEFHMDIRLLSAES
ncbi:hypothetical protein Ciccas_013347 [Cichlidogyrus casuarinus]|uniref:Uncharacterized protein n=1 Tax=Cichlidogyrus casuarinus TaxID=1844966 RepID=A0ABD2PLY0_9PLAT